MLGRVRNYLVFIGILVGLLFRLIQGSIYPGFVGMALPVVVLWPLFQVGAFGAGDIKLFSMLGFIYGTRAIIYIMVAAFFIGAGISLIHIARYGNLKTRLLYLKTYLSNFYKTKERIVYYQKDMDDKTAVIHFSPAILVAFLIFITKCM